MSFAEIVQIAEIAALAIISLSVLFAVFTITSRLKALDVDTSRYPGTIPPSGYNPGRQFAERTIFEAEREFNIVLSRAGREMLTIPVEEAFERGVAGADPESIRRSIFDLISEMRESLHRQGRTGNAQDVIKSFARRFCKIPPFCDGKGS